MVYMLLGKFWRGIAGGGGVLLSGGEGAEDAFFLEFYVASCIGNNE